MANVAKRDTAMLKLFKPIAINERYRVVIKGLAEIFFLPTRP